MKITRAVLLGIICIALLQILYYFPQLPGTLASHFDASGTPNGRMDKMVFVIFYLGIIGIISLLGTMLTWVIGIVPASSINLPNKSYWLDPARKNETIEQLKKSMLWMDNIILIFIVVIMQKVIQFNLSNAQKLSVAALNGILGALVFFVALTFWFFCRRFFKKPSA